MIVENMMILKQDKSLDAFQIQRVVTSAPSDVEPHAHGVHLSGGACGRLDGGRGM